MSQFLLSFTSLPNLHPAVVHFPIVLFPLALLLDVLSLAMPSRREYERFAVCFYGAAALAAAGTYWAGRVAADSLGTVSPLVEPRLALHSDWALYTLWSILLVASARVTLAVLVTRRRRALLVSMRLPVLLAAALTAGALGWTADLGGGLVYKLGVGVTVERQDSVTMATEPGTGASSTPGEVEPDKMGSSPDNDLVVLESGELQWTPGAEAADPMGRVLAPADKGSEKAVTWLPSPGGEGGATLVVDGRALLLLGDPLGDVSVVLDLELSDFSGSVGILHHYAETGTRGWFSASTDGDALLAYGTENSVDEISRARIKALNGRVRIAASSAGRHLKGMLAGQLVAHGHRAAPPDGRCGILLHGKGRVRIISFHLTPLTL